MKTHSIIVGSGFQPAVGLLAGAEVYVSVRAARKRSGRLKAWPHDATLKLDS